MTGSHERHLAQFVDLAGGAVMRSPGSGGSNAGGNTHDHTPGDGRPQPDVLIAVHGVLFAGELKTGSGPHYFEAHEVDALRWFARQMGAHAVLISRFSRDACFRFWDPDQLHRTDGAGNYRAKQEDPPLVVLSDPSSSADDPPGIGPDEVAQHGLHRVMDVDQFHELKAGVADGQG